MTLKKTILKKWDSYSIPLIIPTDSREIYKNSPLDFRPLPRISFINQENKRIGVECPGFLDEFELEQGHTIQIETDNQAIFKIRRLPDDEIEILEEKRLPRPISQQELEELPEKIVAQLKKGFAQKRIIAPPDIPG
jgi:hypothetical protein